MFPCWHRSSPCQPEYSPAMSSLTPLLTTTTRFERKYRCTYPQYHALKYALRPYLIQDLYTQRSSTSRYLVRSIYYDTFDYQIFLEKVGGHSSRAKYRIRTYGDSLAASPDIRVEIKLRQANLTQKFGSFIRIADYQHFLSRRHWPNPDDPVLQEFARNTHLKNLVPKVLVEYEREGYTTRDGQEIRITFDHALRTAAARTLFPDQVFWHDHLEPKVVLEVKHQGILPGWLTDLIRRHGLKIVANSKYALAVAASCKDLLHAGWHHA